MIVVQMKVPQMFANMAKPGLQIVLTKEMPMANIETSSEKGRVYGLQQGSQSLGGFFEDIFKNQGTAHTLGPLNELGPEAEVRLKP